MTRTTGVAIELEKVIKRYRGQERPAVKELTIAIEAGETVAIVGPSGCGKTTTLKMINRLIEPTSGRVLIGGTDVTKADADDLRQGIGYVVQAGGLFPHWTVEKNIGAVPGLLGWDKARTRARVTELLELVGLDPDTFRSRFPKEMSGGQQQRVGVARALAADPPVLLMDEPFGAVDPITRVRLQDQLLAIQEELHKTIVIVTHDVDEAIKLGDRVLILSEGGQIEQFGTPEEILTSPANAFVEEFVGSGATLKHLSLSSVGEIPSAPVVLARPGDPSEEVAARAKEAKLSWVVVVDEDDRPRAWPSVSEVLSKPVVSTYVDQRLPVAERTATLADALDVMLASSQGGVLVTQRGKVIGALTIEQVAQRIRERQAIANPEQAADTYRAAPS
ncbi:ATP-binding cassette domain-containing protein [Tsukamurella tyrosinosolvens]|uniref:ATP-binding cassette domain-containing protein n=1 Tax=Tsukamurella tyrosinosolvens TaxID=57704 RepID=UPI0007956F32|nr:ATP-binding cassette domain-containing protein [Tsukamurella tyrosinosolvens]KXP01851.1 ABC transporter [Tsukamurella tyrosinosolvens]KZL95042.1 ABC transporter [Tsukamurella tyrosinosolvens]MCA4997853.1 ATP-binding cassette domain-containing protein [Tsukamurella tyrosinosolvens]WEL93206.1 ATP-binding cassette domain-containing protein [Tsukamurella tyrosinosolvens]